MFALLSLPALLLSAASLASSAQDFVFAERKLSETTLGNPLGDNDWFGASVAGLGDLDGDGIEDLLVGAPRYGGGTSDFGAVWNLFLAADGRVEGVQKIDNDVGGFGGVVGTAEFGISAVALGDLNGDGTTEVVVGDPQGFSFPGAVWILSLHGDGTVAGEQKIGNQVGGFGGTLTPSDRFGAAVGAVGDLDGDGIQDLAVGAPHDSDGGSSRGAVWILFLHPDGTVKGEAKISDTSGGLIGPLDDYDQFGGAVAGLGDLDGDGIDDVAVGARNDDDGGLDHGAVWILFLQADGTVKAEQKISDTTGGLGGALDRSDHFGQAVAAIGDLDGDGTEDLVVGAPQDDDGGYDHGSLWILFLHPNGTVKGEQKVNEAVGGFGGNLGDLDEFSASLSMLGDLDGDGIVELAVGAPATDDGGFERGAVWILFLNHDGTVKAEQMISATSGGFALDFAAGDLLGHSLAAAGDLDASGVPDLLVGVPRRDTGGVDRGEVWMLRLESQGSVRRVHRIGDGAAGILGPLSDGDAFGAAVASIADLDADGRPELGAGAPGDDDGGPDRGAVWVLFLEQNLKLHAASKISATAGGLAGPLNDGDLFGFATTALADLDGDGLDELVVGAPGTDDGGVERGAVWILFLDALGTVRAERKISATVGGFTGSVADGDGFGWSVAAVGDVDGDGLEELAVGAPGADATGVDRGAVWLLFLDATGAVRTQLELTVDPGFPAGSIADGDLVGTALASGVDLDGDGIADLVAGAPGADDGGTDRGAAWFLMLRTGGAVMGATRISDVAGGFEGLISDRDRFGSALALLGDLDADGHEDLVVGAPRDDDGGADVGAAWLLLCDDIRSSDANAVWRNGSGVNPDVFTSTSLPILGTDWTSTVDGGAVGATGLVIVFGYGGALSGIGTRFGEVLLDPFSEYAFSDWGALGSGTTSHHVLSVPPDPVFLGVRVSTQALLNNVGGAARLTNAWDLVLGH